MASRWLVLAVLCAACGDDGAAKQPDASVDADPFGAPSDMYPAYRPGVPTISKAPAGRVVASPRILQVFFKNDPDVATLEDFLGKFAASPYWSAMVEEYGVGPMTIATPVVLTVDAPATVTDADLQAFLTTELDGTHAEFGAVDLATLQSTIVLLHYPVTTTVTGNGASQPVGCVNMYGYHNVVTLPSTANVAYAVTMHCATPPPHLPTVLDNVTSAIGHELVEAATDPDPFTGFGNTVDPGSVGWVVVPGGAELADMCETLSNSWTRPADLGYTIQRSWSNASANAYHNPCVPIPGAYSPFFATAPDETETVTIFGRNARSMNLHVGVPRTIDLDFLSDGPTVGAWSVDVVDATTLAGKPAVLTLSIDRPMGLNGQRAHLTITASSRPSTGYAQYLVVSKMASVRTMWWGTVGIEP